MTVKGGERGRSDGAQTYNHHAQVAVGECVVLLDFVLDLAQRQHPGTGARRLILEGREADSEVDTRLSNGDEERWVFLAIVLDLFIYLFIFLLLHAVPPCSCLATRH